MRTGVGFAKYSGVLRKDALAILRSPDGTELNLSGHFRRYMNAIHQSNPEEAAERILNEFDTNSEVSH